MLQITLPIHSSTYDREYKRVDIAPRVMGQYSYDGEFGYLVAYFPANPIKKYLIVWDDRDQDFLELSDFVIISNITLTK